MYIINQKILFMLEMDFEEVKAIRKNIKYTSLRKDIKIKNKLCLILLAN